MAVNEGIEEAKFLPPELDNVSVDMLLAVSEAALTRQLDVGLDMSYSQGARAKRPRFLVDRLSLATNTLDDTPVFFDFHTGTGKWRDRTTCQVQMPGFDGDLEATVTRSLHAVTGSRHRIIRTSMTTPDDHGFPATRAHEDAPATSGNLLEMLRSVIDKAPSQERQDDAPLAAGERTRDQSFAVVERTLVPVLARLIGITGETARQIRNDRQLHAAAHLNFSTDGRLYGDVPSVQSVHLSAADGKPVSAGEPQAEFDLLAQTVGGRVVATCGLQTLAVDGQMVTEKITQRGTVLEQVRASGMIGAEPDRRAESDVTSLTIPSMARVALRYASEADPTYNI